MIFSVFKADQSLYNSHLGPSINGLVTDGNTKLCCRGFIACGALAASISVGIVIPSTWFVYLYQQTVSITVVVMGTKQFSDKTTHRQQVKTGFVQKWENRSPGFLQDYSRILPFFKDSISSQFCITQRFKVHFFSQKRRNE